MVPGTTLLLTQTVKRILFWTLVGVAACAVLPAPAAAHPGRTNASGCHTCRTNCSKHGLSSGEYHCHGGGRSSPSSRIKPPPLAPSPPPPPPLQLLGESERLEGRQLPGPSDREPGVRIEILTVVDGDTLVGRKGEGLYLFKLRDLEAPELEQAYGAEARQHLADRVAGRWIVVWPEKGEGCLIPVQAETPEGTDISGLMLSAGLAWAARSAPETLRRFETAARLERVGLWRRSKPEPPWEYRTRRTMARRPERP